MPAGYHRPRRGRLQKQRARAGLAARATTEGGPYHPTPLVGTPLRGGPPTRYTVPETVLPLSTVAGLCEAGWGEVGLLEQFAHGFAGFDERGRAGEAVEEVDFA